MYTNKNSHVLKTIRTVFQVTPPNTFVEPDKESNVDRVVSMVVLKGDKVLVQRHIKLGMLTLPSGKVDQGEAVFDALHREVREETGTNITGYYHVTTSHRYNSITERKLEDYMFVIKLDAEPRNMEPTKHYSQEFESVFDIDQAVPTSQCLQTAISYLGYTDYNRTPYHMSIPRMADFASKCLSINSMAPEIQGFQWLDEFNFTYPDGFHIRPAFYRMVGIIKRILETFNVDIIGEAIDNVVQAHDEFLPHIHLYQNTLTCHKFAVVNGVICFSELASEYFTITPSGLREEEVSQAISLQTIPLITTRNY